MSHKYSQNALVKNEQYVYQVESLIDIEGGPGYGLRNLSNFGYEEFKESDLSTATVKEAVDKLWINFAYNGNSGDAHLFIRTQIMTSIGACNNVSYGPSGDQYKLKIGSDEWVKDRS